MAQKYGEYRVRVLVGERVILEAIGFTLNVNQPLVVLRQMWDRGNGFMMVSRAHCDRTHPDSMITTACAAR